jgi:hypothetical protein
MFLPCRCCLFPVHVCYLNDDSKEDANQQTNLQAILEPDIPHVHRFLILSCVWDCGEVSTKSACQRIPGYLILTFTFGKERFRGSFVSWQCHHVLLTMRTSMVWVRERTIPTERQQLAREVSANFSGNRVLRGQRKWSSRQYSRFSRPEVLCLIHKIKNDRPWRLIGLWDVKDPTLSRQSAHS